MMHRWQLQYITHYTPAIGYEPGALEALRGGCRWIQLRMKETPEADVEDTARRLLPLCRSYGASLIIDDHVEVARRVGADGVHLGRTDMAVDDARNILGPEAIIGGTANTLEDIRHLARCQASYIGCGPYRYTTTKAKLATLLGLEGYRRIVEAMTAEGINIPLVAIGGITAKDIGLLQAVGVHGIAVSGSVLRADSPADEVRRMIALLQQND